MPEHSGPESPKMDKTIYSLVFWAKASIFEVLRISRSGRDHSGGHKMVVTVGLGGKDKVKAMRYVCLWFF